MSHKMSWFAAMGVVATGEWFADIVARNPATVSAIVCAGIFGVVAYSVNRSNKEKGKTK